MTSGRQVRLAGRKMVINLSNKGGVRKSPKQSEQMRKYKACMIGKLAGKGKGSGKGAEQKAYFIKSAGECKGAK